MSKGLQPIAEKILDMTNGGLDIIQEFYPQANDRANFRVREDDKNASCSIYKKDDRYRINDFGGIIKSQDCFGLWALENNCDYWEAIVGIARKLQNEKGVQLLNEKTNVYKYDYAEWKVEKPQN